jgi:hypothetical protein
MRAVSTGRNSGDAVTDLFVDLDFSFEKSL